MRRTVCVAVLAAMMMQPRRLLAQDKAKVHRHKKAAKAETVEPMNSNQASWELAKGASWLLLPSWSLPVVMPIKKNMDDKEAAKKTDKK